MAFEERAAVTLAVAELAVLVATTAVAQATAAWMVEATQVEVEAPSRHLQAFQADAWAAGQMAVKGEVAMAGVPSEAK